MGLAERPSGIQSTSFLDLHAVAALLMPSGSFPPGQVFPDLAMTPNQPITPLTSLSNRQTVRDPGCGTSSVLRIQVLGMREDSRELLANWAKKLPVPARGVVVLWNESHLRGTSKVQTESR